MVKRLLELVLLMLSAVLVLPCVAQDEPVLIVSTTVSVTWTCTTSPCPWGELDSDQALVWDERFSPTSQRLGYTTSEPVYLPASMTAGLTITVRSGSVSLYYGSPDASSQTLLQTLASGESRTFLGLEDGEVLFVQGNATVQYSSPLVTNPVEPPTPTPTPIPTVLLDMSDIIADTTTLASAAGAAWEPDSPTGAFFLGLSGFAITTFLLMFIRSIIWKPRD